MTIQLPPARPAIDGPLPAEGELLFDGRYRIESLAGSGGTADVWLAYDERLHRRVAIKVLKERDAGMPWASLETEGRMLARLSHPNIVSVFDAGSVDGRPFLVSEFVAGRPLREELRGGPLPIERARAIAAQLAAALECAHANGVVHGDVKPENVLLDAHGNAKLADFGLAAPTETVAGTEMAEFAGTIAYISPEVIHGERPAAPSDVYSLGLVLYELLTGVQPYAGPTPAVALARRLAAPPSAERLPSALTAAEAALIVAAINPEASLRPEASELQRAFARAAQERMSQRYAVAALAAAPAVTPVPLPSRQRGAPGLLVALTLPVVAAVAVGLAIFASAGSGSNGAGDGGTEEEAVVASTSTPIATPAETEQARAGVTETATATATPTEEPATPAEATATTPPADPSPAPPTREATVVTVEQRPVSPTEAPSGAEGRGQPVSDGSGPGNDDEDGDDRENDRDNEGDRGDRKPEKPKQDRSGDDDRGDDD